MLNKNYQLRSNALGLLEMQASAAFLRKIDLPEIDSEEYKITPDDYIFNSASKKINILKAFKTRNNALGYRFFIYKPQELLFITDWPIDDKNKKNLLNQGIWFLSLAEFKSKIKKEDSFNHQFLLYSGFKFEQLFSSETNQDNINEIKTLLPLRFIHVEPYKDEFISLISNNKSEGIERKIWELWMNIIIPKNENVIFSPATPRKSSNAINIILFDHLNGSSGNPDPSQWVKAKEFIKNNNPIAYMEALSSNAQNKLPDFNKLAKVGDSLLLSNYFYPLMVEKEGFTAKSKLIESYLSKVVVIDERIQEFSYHNYLDVVPQKEIFQYSNVVIPDGNADYSFQKDGQSYTTKLVLDSTNFDNILIDGIEHFIETNSKDARFLLIHFGILERMYNEKTDSVEDSISKKLKTWAEMTTIIVTSGRGKHSLNLPAGIRYLNLSSVSYAFIENRNKYSINYLLNQSRK